LVSPLRPVFLTALCVCLIALPANADGLHAKDMRGLMLNQRRPIFADRRVREALLISFDFEWTNRVLLGGTSRRIASYFPNSELAASDRPSAGELALLDPFRAVLPPEVFRTSFTPPRTDGSGDEGIRPYLRRAMAQLEAAGWVVRDRRLVDGKTGAPFTFEILLHDRADQRIVIPFVRTLKRLGIAATVRVVDEADYIRRRNRFDFDMILDRWDEAALAEPALCWGSAQADTPGSLNYPGIESPIADALIADMATAKDRVGRLDAAHALDRVLTRGYYVVPLYYPATP
jgi:microcin C transport system substrate-binding protein